MEITNYFLNIVKDNKRIFKDLLQYLIKNYNKGQLFQASSEIAMSMPIRLTSIDNFMETVTNEIMSQCLWVMDCLSIYKYLERKANDKFKLKDFFGENSPEDSSSYGEQDFIVSLFMIVSFSFAYSALIEPQLRKMIGIKKGWFW